MNSLPESRFDRALFLKNILTSLATGGVMDDATYQKLRSEFLSDTETKKLLPQFIRTNLDSEGLWSYFKDYHAGSGAYAARRKHLNEIFLPLLNHLINSGSPADSSVSDTISGYDGQGVEEAWQKALSRRDSDPEGAITAARTLLEEVCKHILDDARISYEDRWDLPKLYSKIAEQMNLAPSKHTEPVFKSILGGCITIVENLGGLRNKMSDAHGGGRQKVRASKRHASLAVNLAGSMTMYLIETWQIMQQEIESSKARKESIVSGIVYKGVSVNSRYNLQAEIDTMKDILDAMSDSATQKLQSIWCDSKANATYSIVVRDGKWVPELQWIIAEAAKNGAGGHNGIFIEAGKGDGWGIDPYWPEDNL